MRFEELARRILNEMRADMKEIYQPAAIIALIYHGGTTTLDVIHEELERRRRERNNDALPRPRSKTKEKPCHWLTRSGIICEDAASSERYQLRDFETYTPPQLTAIVALCEESIAEWNRRHPVNDEE